MLPVSRGGCRQAQTAKLVPPGLGVNGCFLAVRPEGQPADQQRQTPGNRPYRRGPLSGGIPRAVSVHGIQSRPAIDPL